MQLRQFVYFDDSLVDDFLAGLEGGVSDEEQQRQQQSSRRGDADAGQERGDYSEVERTVRQVHASKYARLHELLTTSEPPLLREVEDELDDELWGELRRGDLIAIDSALTVPAVTKFLSGTGGFGGLLTAMEMFSPEGVDDESREAIEGFKALGELGGENDGLTVVGEVAQAPEFRIICKMRRQCLLGDLDDLDTELTVVGKIQRKLRPSDSEFIGDFPGMSLMDRDARRAFIREQRKDTDPMTQAMFVEGPAAILTVLAIFR